MATLANKKLQSLLNSRIADNNYRELKTIIFSDCIDFASNDYLGFARNIITENNLPKGSTGSRLISGNHAEYEITENFLSDFLDSESALIFNSGYTANLGLLSSVPQKNDLIIYDELSHASIRDGVRLALAKSFSFKHNDVKDLEKKLSNNAELKYVVVESVYSMDGDVAPLKEICRICKKHNAYLIVDEAHALGVFGKSGRGLVCELNLQHLVYARVATFGKALGLHGAAVLCNDLLKDYLINFCRPFIYTTGLPPENIRQIYYNLKKLSQSEGLINNLKNRIAYFNNKVFELGLNQFFYSSNTPIQVCILRENRHAKKIADALWHEKIFVKAILHPTVAKGKERIRICLHNYNTEKEMDLLLKIIKNNV